MGVLDKFLDVMKLNDDDDFDDEELYDDYEDDYYDEKPSRRAGFLKKNKDYDDYDEFDDYDYESSSRESSGRFGQGRLRKDSSSSRNNERAQKPAVRQEQSYEREPQKSSEKASAMRPSVPRKAPAGGMEVCLMRPTSVDDSRDIVETLLGNRTVVLNLEGLDLDTAQRIIDFASGACFALSGNLQKISQFIFLLTPANVDISGDLNNLLGDKISAAGNTEDRF